MPTHFHVHLEAAHHGTMRIPVAGEIDAETADMLLLVLVDALAGDVSGVEVDLSRVTFLDAGGVRVLLAGRRRARERGIAFRVRGATGLCQQVLEVAGVLDVLGDRHEHADDGR